MACIVKSICLLYGIRITNFDVSDPPSASMRRGPLAYCMHAPTHRFAQTLFSLKHCQCFETMLSVTEIIWNTSFRMSQPCLGFDQSQQCQFWEELLCSNAWWNCQKVVSARSPVHLKIIIWLLPPHMSPILLFCKDFLDGLQALGDRKQNGLHLYDKISYITAGNLHM